MPPTILGSNVLKNILWYFPDNFKNLVSKIILNVFSDSDFHKVLNVTLTNCQLYEHLQHQKQSPRGVL